MLKPMTASSPHFDVRASDVTEAEQMLQQALETADLSGLGVTSHGEPQAELKPADRSEGELRLYDAWTVLQAQSPELLIQAAKQIEEAAAAAGLEVRARYAQPVEGELMGQDGGLPVRLGGPDSDGELVGYIDPQGESWSSRLERDRAVLAGRYLDAWDQWQRTGGQGPEPQPEQLLEQVEVLPEHRAEALERARESLQQVRDLRDAGS